MLASLINEYPVPTSVIGLLTVLLTGAGVAWLVFRNKFRRLQDSDIMLKRELAVARERSSNKDRLIDELKQQLSDRDGINRNQQNQIERNVARIAELSTLLDEERKSVTEKLGLLEQAELKMTNAFENLSNKILEQKSKKFVEQNKENIGTILTPLREQLGDFRKKIEDVYVKETKDRTALQYEITSLKSLNEKMSRDAINLTNALKGDSKKRGDWGEVILERVLEASGLKNGREYEVQKAHKRADNLDLIGRAGNKSLRPDVVVHLPDKRDVVIDSKVSLNAYERYYSADDEQEKTVALNEHLASIKSHINGLKDKDYAELIGINSLDMVLMFVPIEPALMLALDQDESLFQDAFQNGIFLVSPSTLTMNLQVIQNMWRYADQNQHAQEIAQRAGDLYDKFTGFVNTLEAIGKNIHQATESYEKAYKQLSEGRGNLVSRVEKIRELGNLRTKKQLSADLVNKALPDSAPDDR